MMDNEQKILRFRARLLSGTGSHPNVDYVISLFAVDNTIQIRAQDTPNSGLDMSIFLSRQPVPRASDCSHSAVCSMSTIGEVYFV